MNNTDDDNNDDNNGNCQAAGWDSHRLPLGVSQCISLGHRGRARIPDPVACDPTPERTVLNMLPII